MPQRSEDKESRPVLLQGRDSAGKRPGFDFYDQAVLDHLGRKIGVVKDILIDETSEQIRFLLVSLEEDALEPQETAIVPVDLIFKLTDRAIHLNYKGQRISTAPHIDLDSLDTDAINALYTHYGCIPFWDKGYVYPTFPYATM